MAQCVRGFCQLHLYFSQVISGQQLPKPKDSILGDRGEVIINQMQIKMITYIFDFVLLLTLHIMVYRCQDNDPCKMCEIELF